MSSSSRRAPSRAGLVELGEEGSDVGSRAHHLVGGGQIGPAAEAEDGGDLLAGGEQVEENLLVRRIGAGVVGEEHALAQRGIGGEGHDRLHVGRIGGEGDFAFSVGLVAGDVVEWQAGEFVLRGLDGLAAFLDVAAEFERKARGFLVQGLDVVAGGLILVNAGQAVAEQGALDVVQGGGRGASQVNGGKRLINLAVEAEGASGHGDALGLLLGLVADGIVCRDGVEDAGLGASQAEVLNGLVVEAEGVFRGAGVRDGQKRAKGGLVGGEAGGDPGGKGFSGGGSACFPGVNGVDLGGSGGVLSWHVGENPLRSRLPQRAGVRQVGRAERSHEYSAKSMVAINSCIKDNCRLRCVN